MREGVCRVLRRALVGSGALAIVLIAAPQPAPAQPAPAQPAPAQPGPSPAAAQPASGEPPTSASPSPDHEAQAEKLFDQGKVALDAGDWTAACAFFEASSALHEVPSVLVKLARCRVREQRFAEAIRLHERALAQKPWAELDRLIRAELFEVQKQAPSFRVTLVAPSSGVTLRKNGVLSTTPPGTPVWLDVGVPAHLDAQAAGYRGRSYDVLANEAGETLDVRVELTPEPRTGSAPLAPRVPPGRDESDVQGVLGWTTLGAGSAALALGVIFGAQFLATKDDVYEGCSGTLDDGRRVCPASTAQAKDDAIAARTRSQVLISVGAVVAAGGAVLLLTRPSRTSEHAADTAPGVRVGGPGLVGVF